MAILPAELPTGLVTGQFLFVSEDMVDDDTNPDLTVVTGTINFTCSASILRFVENELILIPLVFRAKLDSNGMLVPANGTGLGVELPASDSVLYNPNGFTWKVEFKLTEVGSLNQVQINSFDIFVTESDDPLVNSLARLMPVTSSGGKPIIIGPKGPLGPVGPVGPVPVITIGTVDVGTPVPVVGPAGPIGPKGDPGGYTSTDLLTTNLNELTIEGPYRQPSTSAGSIANNYPFEGFVGAIDVRRNSAAGSGLVQLAYPRTNSQTRRTIFRRNKKDDLTWTPWDAFNSTRTDQTAGRAIYQWDEVNNREQLIYGDTGTRDITELLEAATGIKPILAQIRRVGYEVFLEIIFANSLPLTNIPSIGILPYGFQGQPGAGGSRVIGSRGGTTIVFTVTSAGSTQLLQYSPSASEVNVFGSYSTRQAWPTTLPGIAVGTIPNL